MGETEKDVGRLEGRVDGLEGRLQSIEEKVDRLLAAAHMGRGAWGAVLRIGGMLVMLAGAFAWIWDHIPKVRT